MQADYTRKTQEIAPFRKAGIEADQLDSVQEALALYQNLQNPDFQRQLYDKLGEVYTDEFEGEMPETEFDDPRDKQLSQLTERIDQFERRALQAEVDADLSRQEAIIRTDNPHWGDADMETVAQLAIAHQGNLLKGAETLNAIQSAAVKKHIETKATVSGAVGTPSGSAHAEVPTGGFDDLDQAHKAALAYYRQNAAN